MKKIFILVFISLLFSNIQAQEKTFQSPNYDVIKKEIQDKSSTYYYPSLMQRFENYDSTLTLEDYRHLYYGYVFQKNYEPYWRFSEDEELLEYYRKKEIKEKDYKSIIRLVNKSLEEFPFELNYLNFMCHIYKLKGDEAMVNKISKRLNGIIQVITSSGDGKTCETGFHVISVSHEYLLLNYFELTMKSQALVERKCDYLALEENRAKIDGLYFNVEKLFGMGIK